LIERSLQSSEAHIESGKPLGISSSKMWRTLGGSETCDRVWQGEVPEGVKISQNWVTYFMDDLSSVIYEL